MREIFTRKGERIIVDDKDFADLSKQPWFIDTGGYARRTKRIGPRKEGKKIIIAMHRYLLGMEAGDSRQVDHINGDRLDNRRENLRICSKDENSRNRRVHSNNRLGVKGVSPHGHKFRSEIQVNNRRVYLGLHDTAELANEFYALAAEMLHGEFASSRM